jgi:hypothetical protein
MVDFESNSGTGNRRISYNRFFGNGLGQIQKKS